MLGTLTTSCPEPCFRPSCFETHSGLTGSGPWLFSGCVTADLPSAASDLPFTPSRPGTCPVHSCRSEAWELSAKGTTQPHTARLEGGGPARCVRGGAAQRHSPRLQLLGVSPKLPPPTTEVPKETPWVGEQGRGPRLRAAAWVRGLVGTPGAQWAASRPEVPPHPSRTPTPTPHKQQCGWGTSRQDHSKSEDGHGTGNLLFLKYNIYCF